MLSEAFLQSLRTLRLNAPRRRMGTLTGERRSVKRGRSVEFADYRNYTPGDDPRRVDWNVYARLERPYIKLFEDEEDLTTHILLDDSPSMFWQPDDEADGQHLAQKWLCAAQLAVVLGYVALASGDKVVLETSSFQRFGPKRGVAAAAALIAFVERVSATDKRDLRAAPVGRRQPLNAWLKRYALDARPGLCILISDMLDEGGYADGFNALGNSRLDVNLLHTLSPDELDPQFTGDLRLKDVETANQQDMSMDDAVLSQYRQRLAAWSEEIAANVRRRGGRYHLTDTSLPLEEIVLKDLRREEWLI
ncbi:MAG: DUF58 domain-containing protein [Anaerolineae bacterium]|nr:DUF58 domain-containing protein [Candidatus Roseilinea sp.]MDW8450586.1 DUF58 domain-containing protein [Anaerolineae bacterium]